MLVLSRRIGEAIRIGSNVSVRVVALQGSQVRLAIEAPDAVSVHREEIYERIAQANRTAMSHDPATLREFARTGTPGGPGDAWDARDQRDVRHEREEDA